MLNKSSEGKHFSFYLILGRKHLLFHHWLQCLLQFFKSCSSISLRKLLSVCSLVSILITNCLNSRLIHCHRLLIHLLRWPLAKYTFLIAKGHVVAMWQYTCLQKHSLEYIFNKWVFEVSHHVFFKYFFLVMRLQFSQFFPLYPPSTLPPQSSGISAPTPVHVHGSWI